ncbi:hypothetical protein OS493_038115 [Desmophyllum pertusum]|uniref:Uncharacterized protein n=1 Tax=Desmophyllum pertusum TaxID=174260 RepID=A0A9W9YA77_9CNID|nr:hypothetical protein OS493_038115 [Desmophyllum pertusum]
MVSEVCYEPEYQAFHSETQKLGHGYMEYCIVSSMTWSQKITASSETENGTRINPVSTRDQKRHGVFQESDHLQDINYRSTERIVPLLR